MQGVLQCSSKAKGPEYMEHCVFAVHITINSLLIAASDTENVVLLICYTTLINL